MLKKKYLLGFLFLLLFFSGFICFLFCVSLSPCLCCSLFVSIPLVLHQWPLPRRTQAFMPLSMCLSDHMHMTEIRHDGVEQCQGGSGVPKSFHSAQDPKRCESMPRRHLLLPLRFFTCCAPSKGWLNDRNRRKYRKGPRFSVGCYGTWQNLCVTLSANRMATRFVLFALAHLPCLDFEFIHLCLGDRNGHETRESRFLVS